MPEHGDLCAAGRHPRHLLLAGGGRGAGPGRRRDQVPGAAPRPAARPALRQDDGAAAVPDVLLRAAGRGGGQRAGRPVGGARVQAEAEREWAWLEPRAGGAERGRGEQPPRAGHGAGPRAGAGHQAAQAAGLLPRPRPPRRHRPQPRQEQGGERAGQAGRVPPRQVQAVPDQDQDRP